MPSFDFSQFGGVVTDIPPEAMELGQASAGFNFTLGSLSARGRNALSLGSPGRTRIYEDPQTPASSGKITLLAADPEDFNLDDGSVLIGVDDTGAIVDIYLSRQKLADVGLIPLIPDELGDIIGRSAVEVETSEDIQDGEDSYYFEDTDEASEWERRP